MDPEFYEFCGDLVEALKNMGFKVTRDKVKNALQAIRPNGLKQFVINADLIRDLLADISHMAPPAIITG